MHIFPLLPTHWPEVERIYLEGLKTGQASFETKSPGWEAWDKSHLKDGRFIAKSEGEIAGWVALSPVSSRQVYSGVAEISIYIDPRYKRKGCGRLLLSHSIQYSEAMGIWTLQAVMFPENTASVQLHRKMGFRLLGKREKIGKREGVWRDTIILERRSRLGKYN